HRRAWSFVRSQNVFELRPIDQSVIKMRIGAGGVSKNILDSGRNELLGEGRSAISLEELDAFRADPAGLLSFDVWCQRLQNRFGRGQRNPGGREPFKKSAPRNRFGQILCNQLSHFASSICLQPSQPEVRRLSPGIQPSYDV